MMTIDLLKQMNTICEDGLKNAKTEEDKTYYRDLKQNISDAIELINKEPAIG